ncbi:MAG: hypothetical protein FJW30_27240 [Acidobacteria bacterium]|nr:hypothetical protein [Acidobacteriota bacterium]
MNRREWLGSLAVGAAAGAASAQAEAPEKKSATEALDLERKIADTLTGKRPYEPLAYPYFSPDYSLPFTHIGTEKQIFLDNFMLEHLEGVERVLTPPEKTPRPLVEETGLAWESAAFNPIVVAAMKDSAAGNFKLWYTLSLSGDPYGTGQVLCIAESNNAIHWTKTMSPKGSAFRDIKATNIVHTDDVSGAGLALNHDQRDPDRRFLLIYAPTIEARKKGARTLSRVAASADGWKWNVISPDADQRHQHESRIIWDESIRQWVSYGQHSHHWHHGPRVRQVGRQTSPDFIHWSPKEVVLSADWDPTIGPDREFHEASVRKVGGLYIAIVGVAHTEPIWNSRTKTLRGMYEGTVWRDQFQVNMALYVSRDGRRFTRAHGPGPWVDNGPYGSQDYGYSCYSCADGMVHDGKLIIPYSAIPVKQWTLPREDWKLVPAAAREKYERDVADANARGMGRDKKRGKRAIGGLLMREDGWAMLRPVREEGHALTKQFVFEGDALRINAECGTGNVRVEALNPSFEPYPGFSAAECAAIHDPGGKTIWHTVRWNGKADVRALWNKPVILRFYLRESALYGFQFVSGGEKG